MSSRGSTTELCQQVRGMLYVGQDYCLGSWDFGYIRINIYNAAGIILDEFYDRKYIIFK